MLKSGAMQAGSKEQGSKGLEPEKPGHQRLLSRNYLSRRGEALRRNSLALP